MAAAHKPSAPSLLENLTFNCFSCCLRHASLVNDVYPRSPGEEGPRASELSRLVFYSLRRPEKLTKVGSYLRRRYTWDAAKDQTAFLRVTLAIPDALIDKCHSHLSCFAKSVVWILNAVLDRSDPTTSSALLEDATVTFIKFASHYDASLDLDNEFFSDFIRLIKRFSAHASGFADGAAATVAANSVVAGTGASPSVLSGLEAIKSVVYAGIVLKSPMCESYVALIVPALLLNILLPLKAENTSAVTGLPSSASDPSAATTKKNALAINLASTSIPEEPDSSGRGEQPDLESGLQSQREITLNTGDSANLPASHASHRLSIYDEVVNNCELATIATATLSKLCFLAGTAHIALVLSYILSFFDANLMWPNRRFSCFVLRIVNKASHVPVQTITLSTILSLLRNSSSKLRPDILRALPNVGFANTCLAVSMTDIVDALMACDAHENEVSFCLDWLMGLFFDSPKDFIEVLVNRTTKPRFVHSALLMLLQRLGSSASTSVAGASSSPWPHPPSWSLDTFVSLFLLFDSKDLRPSVVRLLCHITPETMPALPALLEHMPDERECAPVLAHHVTMPSDVVMCMHMLDPEPPSVRRPALLYAYAKLLSRSKYPQIASLLKTDSQDNSALGSNANADPETHEYLDLSASKLQRVIESPASFLMTSSEGPQQNMITKNGTIKSKNSLSNKKPQSLNSANSSESEASSGNNNINNNSGTGEAGSDGFYSCSPVSSKAVVDAGGLRKNRTNEIDDSSSFSVKESPERSKIKATTYTPPALLPPQAVQPTATLQRLIKVQSDVSLHSSQKQLALNNTLLERNTEEDEQSNSGATTDDLRAILKGENIPARRSSLAAEWEPPKSLDMNIDTILDDV